MIKKKIISILGTRPEFIKMSELLKKLDVYFDHILVNTNQNFEYELNKIFFDDLKIRKPNYIFETTKKTAVQKIADNFIQIEKIFKKENPDAVIVLGDTNSTLVVYVAKRFKIPIIHIEAGNRCFDQRVPEEINRKIVDHLSDINFVYSDLAKGYLIKENLDPQKVIKIGSPMLEVFNKNFSKIKKSKILSQYNLVKKNFFLISFHREEHLDNKNKLSLFFDLLKCLEKNFKMNIVVSTHYKLRDRISRLKKNHVFKKVKFLKPFAYTDYCSLMLNSFFVLSDSGTINEESSVMNFKALNLRETHERPEADEEATVPLTGLDINLILQQIKILKNSTKPRLINDYNVNNFSEKVIRLIGNLINRTNTNTWKKSNG